MKDIKNSKHTVYILKMSQVIQYMDIYPGLKDTLTDKEIEQLEYFIQDKLSQHWKDCILDFVEIKSRLKHG